VNCRGFECIRCPHCGITIQCNRKMFIIDPIAKVICLTCKGSFELELDPITEELIVRVRTSKSNEGNITHPPSGVTPDPLAHGGEPYEITSGSEGSRIEESDDAADRELLEEMCASKEEEMCEENKTEGDTGDVSVFCKGCGKQ
jgi:hypothetical protein